MTVPVLDPSRYGEGIYRRRIRLATTAPGVVRADPVGLLVTAGLYLTVVAFAICIPAFRALRVDPASVLRME